MDSLRKTRSESTKKINVRVIHVKPASDMWINDDYTGWKIAGRDESLDENLTLVSSSKRASPSEDKAKILKGGSTVKQPIVTDVQSVLKHSMVSEQTETDCLEVTDYDSDDDKVGHLQLKQNEPHPRKSILKIPSDLSASRLNLKTETKSSVTSVTPRSIQVRSYNKGSSSSVIGFDLNAGKVLKEESSGAVVIRHSKCAEKELPSGHCPALEIYFGNKGASCSSISPNNQSSINHQLKPDSKFSVDRNKSWKTPEPLGTKTTGREKKRKSKRKKTESKVNYTPVEKFEEPTDAELKRGKKKTSKNVFKMLTKTKSNSSSRSLTT
ncbi:hypothetical protein LOTGIDRAFT_153770 [Lottia gigantea]|uniref:Uncharacterized protein n=1 Tax=Lottia gigantea TaxID=225164 RepID=V4BR69_LOTGI|nr:hypothetical protein LOTGIDRAFT_153770 [Lottia gigantea]ESO91334.1 hypothetical protein LOTGIDRAFT_153770 [Lottia gigantea]